MSVLKYKDRRTGEWKKVNQPGAVVVDYNKTTNKPQINGYTLEGNKTAAELNLVEIDDLKAYASKAELANYVKKTDIVDNLESIATDQPLSAAQGKTLNDKILEWEVVDEW